MMKYTTKWGQSDEVYDDAAKLRTEIFVVEQGFIEEFDEIDEIAQHMVVYDEDGAPVATGRLYEEEGDQVHAGRIAVVKRLRGAGLGRVIMEELERKAAEMGAKRIILGAQVRVKGFYAALGYRENGDVYREEYCEHVPMAKDIA